MQRGARRTVQAVFRGWLIPLAVEEATGNGSRVTECPWRTGAGRRLCSCVRLCAVPVPAEIHQPELPLESDSPTAVHASMTPPGENGRKSTGARSHEN